MFTRTKLKKNPMRTIVFIAMLLPLLSACGRTHIDVSPKYTAPEIPLAESYSMMPGKVHGYVSTGMPKEKNRTYATVNIYLDDRVEAEPIAIEIKRRDNAYLAETTLYEEEQFTTNLSVGRDKEQKFVGRLSMRWNF